MSTDEQTPAEQRLASNPADEGTDQADVENATKPDDIEERIRRKAHDIYRARNDSDGSELEDWLAAEREVRGDPAPRQDLRS